MNMTTVSIVGNSYLQPAVDLLARTLSTNRRLWRTQVMVNSFECGHAAGSCLLAMLCLESFIVRLAYLKGGTKAGRKLNALAFFEQQYPKYHSLQKLREAFVLRDLLAHNHLWEIESKTNSSGHEVITRAVLHPGFGDPKFEASLAPTKRKTKHLRLHAIPTQVGREDAVKIHETVYQALKQLEEDDINICQTSNLMVHFRGRYREWHEVIRMAKQMVKK